MGITVNCSSLATPALAAKLKGLEQGSTEYDATALAIKNSMGSGHKEVLKQLVMTGPVEDGDVVSKSARNDLMDWGLASRACVKGEQGYTVANYTGWDVFKSDR